MYPAIYHLDIHLKVQHQVRFNQDEDLLDVEQHSHGTEKMLSEYFQRNCLDVNA